MFIYETEGLDFYYQHQQDSRKLVEFLQGVVPCKLVAGVCLWMTNFSHYINNYHYKHLPLYK